MIEATEQSNQLNPPKLSKVIKLKDFLEKLDDGSKFLFADVNSKDNLKSEALKETKSLSVLIGPEGDFSPKEVKLALENGYKGISLGESRLRTETAGIVACHIINLTVND